jgi:hypothetical protein
MNSSGDKFAMKTWMIAAALAISFPALGASGAFAQAGSTGGTLGNTDKSISGERQEPQEPKSRAPRASRDALVPRNAGCQRIVGTWAWHYVLGTTETVFASDGTGTSSTGLTNTWTCSGSLATIKWSHGFTDRAQISPDGRSLSITNNAGQSFSATRK